MGTRDKLLSFRRRRMLVEFTRPHESAWVHGYVLGVGEGLFLTAKVDERIRFDGFEVFRVADVRNLDEHGEREFVEEVRRRRGLATPKAPRIRLGSMAEVVRSAGRLFPLVVLHRERVDPDVCHIGRVLAVDDKKVTLHAIDPGAVWGSHDTRALREVTRVGFGGDYENALALVGGKPPAS